MLFFCRALLVVVGLEGNVLRWASSGRSFQRLKILLKEAPWTAIDVAAGVIMAQNRCSQDAAITILRKASSSRDVKLYDVALGVIASISPEAAARRTHFDE